MHTKIQDMERLERPRERLVRYGTDKLRDEELLAVVIGSGIRGVSALELARQVLRNVQAGKNTLSDLRAIKGLGKTKAAQIVALLALGKRFAQPVRPEILSPEEVWKQCADFRSTKREHFVAFYLDTHNKLIERQLISIGTLDTSLVHPREVFEPAIAKHAAGIVVAHNHPSGSVEPSRADRDITERLRQAGKLVGIPLLDHVIVTATAFAGFAGRARGDIEF